MRIDIIKKEANDILANKKAKSSCIEYKASELQLDKILKTICAYANNYYENDSSLIFIGVEEKNDGSEKAIPIIPIKGIEEGHLEIAKNILNSLRPFLYPNVKFDIISNEFEDKKYLLVIVEKQLGGPFTVTDRALDKKIGLKPGRYVRVESDTRIATVSEEYALIRKFAQYHFTSETSNNATINDLDIDYLKEYLSLTSDRSIQKDMTKESIGESLNLFEKNESLSSRVKNFAVLMFANRPDKFIPYANLEIIVDTLGDTSKMEAKNFTGPIWKQYYSALKYIDDNFVRTITLREDGIATNKKISNFPFKAIEELLANAIVHKNYESNKSIQVYINENEINIINYNSPLPPITIRDLNNRYYFHERDTINPEIRDMFKALGIIESYGTGIGEAKKSCGDNKEDSIYYKEFKDGTDITSVVIPCNKQYCDLVNRKMRFDGKNLRSNDRKVRIESIIKNSGYKVTIKNNLNQLMLEFIDSVFSAKEIIGLLNCVPNTATKYIKKLLELDLIEKVDGLGKGKYKFK